MRDDEYCEISIDNFFNMNGEMPFDCYIYLASNKYTKIFKRGDQVDRKRFELYQKKGVRQLFILRVDRREYIAATEMIVTRILSEKDMSTAKAKEAIGEMAEQTLFEIFDDRIFDEESIRRANKMAKIYVDMLTNDIRSLAGFINLARNETYLCRHSIATSIFGLLLAKADDNQNEKTMMIVGLAGLLHDVGMSKMPKEINDADRKLTNDEWAMVKSHPMIASKMIDSIPAFPAEVKMAIEQHHEFWNGKGYPKGVKGDEIFYPARIIAIADSFSALTTRRGGRALYSPENALAIMSTEDGSKYDPKLLKTFIQLFAASRKKPDAA